MKLLNSVLLEGTLTEAPSFVKSPSGITETTFLLDIGTPANIPIIIYGKQAEQYSQVLDKGDIVRIFGHLSADPTTLYLIAEHIEIKPSSRMQKVGVL